MGEEALQKPPAQSPERLDRRRFLTQLLSTVAAGATSRSALCAAAAALESCAHTGASAGLSAGQWQMLAAVQAHLLPSEPGIPGAREVNATGYLRLLMTDPRTGEEQRVWLRDGLVELAELSSERFASEFISLTKNEREVALRALERSPSGERWLAALLDFLLEALLGDPSHGGNPDGIGWRWLGITPGFPRPPIRRGASWSREISTSV